MRARAQVWCLAVSSLGDFVVSGGADRSLRVWQRTEEPFFVEEEKERRLESLFEADLEVWVPPLPPSLLPPLLPCSPPCGCFEEVRLLAVWPACSLDRRWPLVLGVCKSA